MNAPHRRETMLLCPRDATRLSAVRVEGTSIHECARCAGRFFGEGEMYTAIGAHADPSFWDRPECTAKMADSTILCPRCRSGMHLLTLATASFGPYRGEGVRAQVDRCTSCRGVWLDHGESEDIVLIGQWMIGRLEAERAQAAEELARMPAPELGRPIGGSIRALVALLARGSNRT